MPSAQDYLESFWNRVGDRYECLAALGQGAFGKVFKARQRATGQLVAVKVAHVPEGLSREDIDCRRARFERETHLCARLHHPNIVQLIDSGRTDEGLLYTVFAFAPGETLAELIVQRDALPITSVKHLMLQVLDALACAHAQGVIHRDLKPRNIIVNASGARPNAVVLDFGIGALVAKSADAAAGLTGSFELIGTPGYAAPEQLRALQPTPACDLFSWGLVFLESLTGAALYSGQSIADTVYQQLSPDPIPLPEGLIRHPLGELLRAVTEKDPANRPQSAVEVFEALQACNLSGLPWLKRDRTHGRRGQPAEWNVIEATLLVPQGASGVIEGRPHASGVHGPMRAGLPPGGHPISGSRRSLTVLATSVLGSRGEGDQGEDEMLETFAQCSAIVREHGGHFASALGHEAIYYFGYPQSTEDDAQRAARAALGIQRARRARTAGDPAPSPGLGLGLHLGFVADDRSFGHDGTLSLGNVPALATRLARQGGPLEISLSSEAARTLRQHFEITSATSDPARSLLQGVRQHKAASPTKIGEPRFVAREREVAVLLDRWNSAQSGNGQFLVVSGEPGMGKSRLVREVVERTALPRLLLEGQCAPDMSSVALHPIATCLGRALSLENETSEAHKLMRLEAELLRLALPPAQLLPVLAPLFSLTLPAPYQAPRVSPQRLHELMRETVLSVLFALTQTTPVLLRIEDLHWADPSTLGLLKSLSTEVHSAAICLLATARPEFSLPFDTLEVLHLRLNRLDTHHVERMLLDMAGAARIDPAVVAQIDKRTDGVPLFVEELTRSILDDGLLAEHQGSHTLSHPLDAMTTPPTLRQAIAARLDRLGQNKVTAQVAAVLGPEFRLPVLAAVLGIDESSLETDLEQLLSQRILEKRRRGNDALYSFRHALVREAALASLLGRKRKELHRSVALLLRDEFADLPEAHPSALAHQFEEAGLWLDAARCLGISAKKSMLRAAHLEAIAELERGVRLLEGSAESIERDACELRLRVSLCAALIATRGPAAPEVEQNALRALALCERLKSDHERFPVLYTLWLVNIALSRREESTTYAERLVALANHLSQPALHLTAHFARGITLFFQGRYREAHREFDAAFSFYDPSQHAALAQTYGDDHGIYALAYRAYAEVHLGDIERAQATEAAYLALAEQVQDPLANALAWSCSVTLRLRLEMNDPDDAIRRSKRLMDLSRERGFPFWHSAGQCSYGSVLARHGEPQKGAREIEDSIRYFRSISQKLPLTYYLARLAEAELAAGELSRADAAIEEALVLAETHLEVNFLPDLLSLKAEVVGIRDRDWQRADHFCRQAEEIAQRYEALLDVLRVKLTRARLSQLAGDVSGAQAHATSVRAMLAAKPELAGCCGVRAFQR